jgi:molybdate transport system regulatory protein
MKAPRENTPGYRAEPRLRIFCGEELVIGSGKMLLLQTVRDTGSISEAARQMEISYNHAWKLIQLMNRHFQEPLVDASRGGKGAGGAILTETGTQVLNLYRKMQNQVQQAIEPGWATMRGLMVEPEEGK